MKHPLHPALVHFPVACWSLATAADFGSLWWGEPAWRFSGAVLAIGTLAALAAMLAGFYEFSKLDADNPAQRLASRHMLFAMTAWICYAASLLLRMQGMAWQRPDAIALGLSAAGFVALCATGWLGGTLVYQHRVGTRAPSIHMGSR